jgi:hypothetical protein
MAITQNPATVVKIGFQDFTLDAYGTTSVTFTHSADIEHVTGNGTFLTSVIRNKSHTIAFDGVIEHGTALDEIVSGDAFSIGPSGSKIVYLCTSATVTLSDGASRISIQGIKHADAAYEMPES